MFIGFAKIENFHFELNKCRLQLQCLGEPYNKGDKISINNKIYEITECSQLKDTNKNIIVIPTVEVPKFKIGDSV